MGIPQFIQAINSIYSESFIRTTDVYEKIKNNNAHIMIDFNSFIHDAFYNYQKTVFTEIKNKISDNDVYDEAYSEVDKYIETINQQLDDTITNKVINELELYLNSMNFNKKVVLFIDGIPPFAKIVEQLKRSFMGILEKKYEDKIFMEYITHPDSLIMRYHYLKRNFREISVSPSDKIMNMITSKLKIKLPGVEIADHAIYGEGEAKMITYIKNHKLDNCIVVSSDADLVILLSLLFVNHDRNKLYLTKKTSETRDVLFNKCIDISELCNGIFSFYNGIDKINIKNIINDICFIFSFMGNDFIPGNFYFDANDVFILMKMYEEYLLSDENDYIILYEGGKYNLNMNQLYVYISFLKEYEKFRQFWYNTTSKYLNVPIDSIFMVKYFGMKLDNLESEMLNQELAPIYFKQIDSEFINTFIYNSLKNEYQFENSDDEQNIVKSLATFKSSIGSDNKKFMGFIDENLGSMNISNDNKISYQDENTINKYYHDLFFNGAEISDVCNNYIEMLHWLVEYYYNFNYVDVKTSLCYYKYSQAPLLTSLHSYLSSLGESEYDKFKKEIIDDVKRKQIPLWEYFNFDSYKIYRAFGGQFEKIQQTQINKDVINMFPRIPFTDLLENTNAFKSNVKCQGVRFFSNCKAQFIVDKIPDPQIFINLIKSSTIKLPSTQNIVDSENKGSKKPINVQDLKNILMQINNNEKRRNNIINLLKKM